MMNLNTDTSKMKLKFIICSNNHIPSNILLLLSYIYFRAPENLQCKFAFINIFQFITKNEFSNNN